MALQYTLTLSTVVEPGRKVTATTWSLAEGAAGVIASAACPGDEHGDHARADGRAAARKDALRRGLRIVDANVRVVYERPAVASPTPVASPPAP